MTVSHVVRLHGVSANQVFTWRRQYQNGNLTVVSAGEEVVSASKLTAAMKQIKELQRPAWEENHGDRTTQSSGGVRSRKKMDSARVLASRGYELTLISRCLNVSRAQLSLYLHRPADWQESSRQRSRGSPDSEAHR